MVQEHHQRFGRYALEARIGRGGMAETWRARLVGEAGVTKPVLIKKVLPEYANDEAFVSMFISEARISASLSHGSIAQVFDFGRVDDEYFLAMEFVDGQPLNRVIKRAMRSGFACLPLPIATFIALEMCRGLHYAHTRADSKGAPLGIVHRDISPDNVLISYEGQVKIVDFGIAKARSLRSFETAPGLVKGKYLFFSPEQARGEQVDARTDVWATGVVLYEMVCGKPPLSGPEHVVMHKLLKREPLPRPREVRPDLPAGLDAILQKALALNKEDRYESANAFGDALAGFLYTSTPRFSPMSVAYLLRELFRPDMKEEGRDTRVPPTFVEELSVWLTSPNIPKPTEPAAQQLTRELKSPRGGSAQALDGEEAPDEAARNRDAEGLFANGFRFSQYHLVTGGAVLALLALAWVAFSRLKADWTPPERAERPGPPASMRLPPVPPPEPPPPSKPADTAPPATAVWPVESFQLDARQHVFRVSSGLAALGTLDPGVAWRVVEAPPPSIARGKPMPPLFYLLTGGTVPADAALGTVSRKPQTLHGASGVMVFTVGPPTSQEDLPERTVVVTNTQSGVSRRLTVHPEWMTAALDKGFLLRGLDATESYRLAVEPVGEGA
ncbi:MAG TPA: serine/threonine-protein kinase, partial [Myxococcus sp.]|nr:serine/threonine-protein kinase [Myxococcus sp.]